MVNYGKRLPFELSKPPYDAVTEAAFEEARGILAGVVEADTYYSLGEMNKAIDLFRCDKKHPSSLSY